MFEIFPLEIIFICNIKGVSNLATCRDSFALDFSNPFVLNNIISKKQANSRKTFGQTKYTGFSVLMPKLFVHVSKTETPLTVPMCNN